LKLFSAAKKDAEFVPGDPPQLLQDAVDPFYHERFKGLRAKIEYKIDMVDLRVLAVTSAIAAEGKTLTAINLAASMASTGRKKVALVDLDLRKAGIAKTLGMGNGPGLTDFLTRDISWREISRPSKVPGLSIVAGGRPIPSPADTLAGEKFRAFVAEIRGQFDLVIFDTPPILPVPDALTIAEQIDAFVMLFRLNHTPQQLFRQAVEELGERKIMGVVLNGEEKKSDRYYTRYYGKYYRSGNGRGDGR
jgi:protein-tyrosine kinase